MVCRTSQASPCRTATSSWEALKGPGATGTQPGGLRPASHYPRRAQRGAKVIRRVGHHPRPPRQRSSEARHIRAPGCRVGRAQRGGTAAGLCQVHSWSARRGQAAHLAGHSTERDKHQAVMDFGATSAQPPAYVCQEPHTAAHVMAGNGKIVSRIRAGQAALSLLIAEGVGFEPTRTRQRPSGFQDRRHRPLGEPSWCRVQPLTSVITEGSPDSPSLPAVGCGCPTVARM
jgi:hypothetical protein